MTSINAAFILVRLRSFTRFIQFCRLKSLFFFFVSQEYKVKAAHRELQEREQRLQVAQSRVAHQEQQLQQYEKKLTGWW